MSNCKGQRFGHNFPFTGSDCLNCGINQRDLSGNIKKPELPDIAPIRKPVRGMHSDLHYTAKEASEFCGEPRSFGLYLGIIKRIGTSRAWQIMSELKEIPDRKSRARLFMFKSKKHVGNKTAPSNRIRN